MTHSCTFTQHWNACWAGTSRRRGVLALLAATGTPDSIAALGKRKIETLVATGSPRMAHTLPAEILATLGEQAVTIPATDQYGRVIRGLASQLLTVLEQRDTLRTELEDLPTPTRWPRSSPPCPCRPTHAIELLRTIGDRSTSPARPTSPPTPASPLPPTSQDARSRASATPAAGTGRSEAPFTSAFASLKHPPSRTYYDRKRAEGKSHTAALTCSARRRVDVIHAMIRDRQRYQPDHPIIAGKARPALDEPQ